MRILLKRIAYNNYGTFGVLIHEEVPFVLTLENKWLENQKMISSIPLGIYTCKRVNSPKFGNTFEVTDVPGRTHILFHKGNLDNHTHGCILVGEQFGILKGEPAILSSRVGFQEFLYKTRNIDTFNLHIME